MYHISRSAIKIHEKNLDSEIFHMDERGQNLDNTDVENRKKSKILG